MAEGKLYILTAISCSSCGNWKISPDKMRFDEFLRSHKIPYEYVETQKVEPITQGPTILREAKWRPMFVWVPRGTENDSSKGMIFGSSRSYPGGPLVPTGEIFTTNNLVAWMNSVYSKGQTYRF